ncbi:SDR family oxidoreductase [Paracoccus methylarcula]|uniref:SDR family NAD(P)-dependent oxidoreductase n=1 Tax=Paracoccus methylarcula TaxID=72022 RepID=A0A422QYP2_9RHOB|nr:SDR family oxidoreductase [Paracoccus methylarcula]RNF35013.1 SDR family NAD(P)-dependent oxidoreductase [Paracoccus methylarcula]
MSGKSILVTGAGSGIGRAAARLFLDRGWRVGLIGRRPAPLEETAQGYGAALVLPCDVTDAQAVGAAFAKAAGEWGRVDALFNNAGTNVPGKPIDEISVEEWRQVCDINITGMFLAARAAFGQMRRQDPMGGRIINNGSISAHVPRPGSVPYTMSKHAVTGLTRTLSLDGRPFDIACGQIDIGNALTDMAERMIRGVPQADGSTAVEPVINAAIIADAVLHMAELPLEANVQFMTVMATKMPFIGRG